MTPPRRTVVLLSMGYDSLSTWHQLGRPAAVHFDVGSRYTTPELSRYERLRSLHPQLLPVQDLRWLGAHEQEDGWVPFRNLLMVVGAAALGFDDVVMSAPSDWAPDKRLLFTVSASLAMRVSQPGGGYRVRRPFRRWTKARLIAATPPELLREYAYSCYRGTEPPCGQCAACGRAAIAHLAAGRAPPFDLPEGLNLRELMDLRRGSASKSRLQEAVGMRVGELIHAPARGLELIQAWRYYRGG